MGHVLLVPKEVSLASESNSMLSFGELCLQAKDKLGQDAAESKILLLSQAMFTYKWPDVKYKPSGALVRTL